MAVVSGIETITPETASKWLATSRLNRTIYNKVVDRYVRAMTTDNWMVNGEAIVFDNTKTLVNGHHRLHACIKAGKSFQSMVVRGVEPTAFETFDSGRGRSATDVFGLQGYDNPRDLAATLGLLFRYRNGVLEYRSKLYPSVQELEDALRMYPESVSSVDYCKKVRGVGSVAIISFIHTLGSRTDQYKADQFVDSLYDGADLGVQSPIRLLRERYLQHKGRGSGFLPQIVALALAIKAYNYFAAEQPMTILKWVAGEVFPTFGQIDQQTMRTKRSKEKRLPAVA